MWQCWDRVRGRLKIWLTRRFFPLCDGNFSRADFETFFWRCLFICAVCILDFESMPEENGLYSAAKYICLKDVVKVYSSL